MLESPRLIGRAWPSARLGCVDAPALETDVPWVICLLGPVVPADKDDPGLQRVIEWARLEPVLRAAGYELLAVSTDPEARWDLLSLALGLQWAMWSDPELCLAQSLGLAGSLSTRTYVPATLVIERGLIVAAFWRVDALDAEATAGWVGARTATRTSSSRTAEER